MARRWARCRVGRTAEARAIQLSNTLVAGGLVVGRGHLERNGCDRARVGVVGLAQGPGSADEERAGGLDEIADLVAEAHIDQVAIGESGRGDGLGAEFLLPPGKWWYKDPKGAPARSTIAFTLVVVAADPEQICGGADKAVVCRWLAHGTTLPAGLERSLYSD